MRTSPRTSGKNTEDYPKEQIAACFRAKCILHSFFAFQHLQCSVFCIYVQQKWRGSLWRSFCKSSFCDQWISLQLFSFLRYRQKKGEQIRVPAHFLYILNKSEIALKNPDTTNLSQLFLFTRYRQTWVKISPTRDPSRSKKRYVRTEFRSTFLTQKFIARHPFCKHFHMDCFSISNLLTLNIGQEIIFIADRCSIRYSLLVLGTMGVASQ